MAESQEVLRLKGFAAHEHDDVNAWGYPELTVKDYSGLDNGAYPPGSAFLMLSRWGEVHGISLGPNQIDQMIAALSAIRERTK